MSHKNFQPQTAFRKILYCGQCNFSSYWDFSFSKHIQWMHVEEKNKKRFNCYKPLLKKKYKRISRIPNYKKESCSEDLSIANKTGINTDVEQKNCEPKSRFQVKNVQRIRYPKKRYYCMYCGTLHTHLTRHLECQHGNEEEVKAFMQLENGIERTKLITHIRLKGISIYNSMNPLVPITTRMNYQSDSTLNKMLKCFNKLRYEADTRDPLLTNKAKFRSSILWAKAVDIVADTKCREGIKEEC